MYTCMYTQVLPFVCQDSPNWAEPNKLREATIYVNKETTRPAEPMRFQNCTPISTIQKRREDSSNTAYHKQTRAQTQHFGSPLLTHFITNTAAITLQEP